MKMKNNNLYHRGRCKVCGAPADDHENPFGCPARMPMPVHPGWEKPTVIEFPKLISIKKFDTEQK